MKRLYSGDRYRDRRLYLDGYNTVSKHDVQKLEEVNLAEILEGRTSSSGTKYAVLVLPNSEWIFAWEGAWKDEAEENREIYLSNPVDIYLVDKEEDPDDHFYNLKAVVPSDPETAGKLFEMGRPDRFSPVSEEKREEAMQLVEEIYG